MTDDKKLCCPFCGAELDCSDGDSFIVCPNSKCVVGNDPMEKIVWQTLISGKRAQDAVKYALKVLKGVDEIGGIDLEIMKIKEMTKQED